jgi:hypothetical protein
VGKNNIHSDEYLAYSGYNLEEPYPDLNIHLEKIEKKLKIRYKIKISQLNRQSGRPEDDSIVHFLSPLDSDNHKYK